MLEKKIGNPLVIDDYQVYCRGTTRSGETLFEINHHSVFVKIHQKVQNVRGLHILYIH